MNFLFILVFACSTWSDVTLAINRADRDLSPPVCISAVQIAKTEKEVFDYYTNPKYKAESSLFGSAISPNLPDKIYRLDTKTGEMKLVKVEAIVEYKKKMVEQEEKIIKGYEIK